MTELQYDERVAIARLRALLELLPTALDRELAPEGITSFEFALLEALSEAPDGRLRLSALAARTNATLPRLSRVVTGLERKGLVLRAACEEDGRATNAVLTPAGERAYRASRPRHDDAVRRMVLDGLGEGGAERLADVAFAILDKLDPDRRLAVTADGCAADPLLPPVDARACAADPAAS
ncbi:MarR family winged helix-turn-helix transcriptional regulator [Microbacterium aureliae]